MRVLFSQQSLRLGHVLFFLKLLILYGVVLCSEHTEYQTGNDRTRDDREREKIVHCTHVYMQVVREKTRHRGGYNLTGKRLGQALSPSHSASPANCNIRFCLMTLV